MVGLKDRLLVFYVKAEFELNTDYGRIEREGKPRSLSVKSLVKHGLW